MGSFPIFSIPAPAKGGATNHPPHLNQISYGMLELRFLFATGELILWSFLFLKEGGKSLSFQERDFPPEADAPLVQG